MEVKQNVTLKYLKEFFFLFIGTVLAAIALEFILIPNKIIDGGVVGISIIVSHLVNMPVSLFTFLLNVPFLFFGYKQIGRTFVVKSLFAITSLSLWLSVLNGRFLFTEDVFLASVFGGILLGIGVGTVIRYGGSLDGTEMVAIVLDKKTTFSVGQIVMFFNLFILSSAGLVFSPDRAMYSLVTYFVAYKFMDMVVEGFEKEKAILVITDKGEEVGEAITARLGRGVTFLEGKGGYSKGRKQILYSVITRLEIAKLKDVIKALDKNAFVTVSDVSDVVGGKNRKKNIH
ncbi:MAG: YitT family protein [Clostridiales bacterium]|nr:YitT family protein [Clostridiales bacterium]